MTFVDYIIKERSRKFLSISLMDMEKSNYKGALEEWFSDMYTEYSEHQAMAIKVNYGYSTKTKMSEMKNSKGNIAIAIQWVSGIFTATSFLALIFGVFNSMLHKHETLIEPFMTRVQENTLGVFSAFIFTIMGIIFIISIVLREYYDL